jgi:hypothetical protein
VVLLQAAAHEQLLRGDVDEREARLDAWPVDRDRLR